MNIHELATREKVPIYSRMKPKPAASHLVSYKKEKEYDFYKCDFCGEQIKILKDRHEMTGGTIKFTHLVTKCGDIELALHNKCLNPVLKILENKGENK